MNKGLEPRVCEAFVFSCFYFIGLRVINRHLDVADSVLLMGVRGLTGYLWIFPDGDGGMTVLNETTFVFRRHHTDASALVVSVVFRAKEIRSCFDLKVEEC
jgi:hypothetical protein